MELVQSAHAFPDISGLATKTDLADMVTKTDLKTTVAGLATKADIADMATKTDLTALAHTTEMSIQALKADLAMAKTQILVELSERLRSQSLAFLGGVTAIVGLATAIIKLAP